MTTPSDRTEPLIDSDPVVDAIVAEFRDATGKLPHHLRPPPWWRRVWQQIRGR